MMKMQVCQAKQQPHFYAHLRTKLYLVLWSGDARLRCVYRRMYVCISDVYITRIWS